jgi:hypothetical protein
MSEIGHGQGMQVSALVTNFVINEASSLKAAQYVSGAGVDEMKDPIE